MRLGSELWDYENIARAFLRKSEDGKHATGESQAQFARMVYILRTNDTIRRDDLAEQLGCATETVSRYVGLLKRFSLLTSGRHGYEKKPKFNKFLHQFLASHPDFFDGCPTDEGGTDETR